MVSFFVLNHVAHIHMYICMHCLLITWIYFIYTARQFSGQHTDTINTWVFITAWCSILTICGSHLLGVSFTTNLGIKFVRISYHIIHNREGMFYLTRTKHDCTSVQCIGNVRSPLRKRLPGKTEKFRVSKTIYIYTYIRDSASLSPQQGASCNMQVSCEYIE